MNGRNVTLFLTFLLWAVMTFLTFYELFVNGPTILVLISLVIVGTLGVGVFGALREKRGGPR